MQDWDPARYAANARFVSELGAPVLELLAPRAGERILDLGCGDGALTEKIAARGADVVGVDASADQVAAARARGLDARVADAQALPFVGEFDAVFSNAVLHWVRDQSAMMASVHRALKPGGRFVGEMGGAGCIQTIRAALHEALRARGIDPESIDPWTYPTEDEYTTLFHQRGFVVRDISRFPRPTPLPGDVTAWLETFAGAFLHAVPPDVRQDLLADVRDRVKPTLYEEGRGWTADYMRLRFFAVRP